MRKQTHTRAPRTGTQWGQYFPRRLVRIAPQSSWLCVSISNQLFQFFVRLLPKARAWAHNQPFGFCILQVSGSKPWETERRRECEWVRSFGSIFHDLRFCLMSFKILFFSFYFRHSALRTFCSEQQWQRSAGVSERGRFSYFVFTNEIVLIKSNTACCT